MDNNSSKEILQNAINSFLNKGIDINDESKEKILNIISYLSAEDIKKITELTKNNQLQKLATNMVNKDKQKR